MRCKYREKMYRCGDYLTVDIYPVFHQGGKKTRRRAKYKPTSAMQAKLNQKNAEEALTRLLEANFCESDLEITLTFSPDNLPDTYDLARRHAENYLRRVKRLRNRRELSSLKYVLIPGNGRFHFHIVMTGGIDRDELERIWGLGYANTKRLSFRENGVAGLARYIASQYDIEDFSKGEDLFSIYDIDEETGELTEKNDTRKKGQRRWSSSKNLIRPEPQFRDGKISSARVEELASVDSSNRVAFEKLYPGYSLLGVEPYYNPDNGGYYLHVRMYSAKKRRSDRTV